jgi:hypothetical protein
MFGITLTYLQTNVILFWNNVNKNHALDYSSIKILYRLLYGEFGVHIFPAVMGAVRGVGVYANYPFGKNLWNSKSESENPGFLRKRPRLQNPGVTPDLTYI